MPRARGPRPLLEGALLRSHQAGRLFPRGSARPLDERPWHPARDPRHRRVAHRLERRRQERGGARPGDARPQPGRRRPRDDQALSERRADRLFRGGDQASHGAP